MIDRTNSATLEVVSLPNGRYTVRTIGEDISDDETGEFETQEEAEEDMFERMQQLDAGANDMGVMKPGSGQGIS